MFRALRKIFSKKKKRIVFLKWTKRALNSRFHGLGSKFEHFALEAGEDIYNRYFIADPLVDYAINANITEKSAEYIYRHYVYSKLAITCPDEVEDLLGEFYSVK